eukprot:4926050-Amphidinium_carterae.1
MLVFIYVLLRVVISAQQGTREQVYLNVCHAQPSDAIAQAVATHLTGEAVCAREPYTSIHAMSRIERRSLTHEEASLLLQCGSFWPDSM